MIWLLSTDAKSCKFMIYNWFRKIAEYRKVVQSLQAENIQPKIFILPNLPMDVCLNWLDLCLIDPHLVCEKLWNISRHHCFLVAGLLTLSIKVNVDDKPIKIAYTSSAEVISL